MWRLDGLGEEKPLVDLESLSLREKRVMSHRLREKRVVSGTR